MHRIIALPFLAATLFLGACTSPRVYDGIPQSAATVASGEGNVEWRAEGSGRIWVGDDKDQRMLVSSDVHPDDVVEVEACGDQVKINERVVFEESADRKHRASEKMHQHSVFFR